MWRSAARPIGLRGHAGIKRLLGRSEEFRKAEAVSELFAVITKQMVGAITKSNEQIDVTVIVVVDPAHLPADPTRGELQTGRLGDVGEVLSVAVVAIEPIGDEGGSGC